MCIIHTCIIHTVHHTHMHHTHMCIIHISAYLKFSPSVGSPVWLCKTHSWSPIQVESPTFGFTHPQWTFLAVFQTNLLISLDYVQDHRCQISCDMLDNWGMMKSKDLAVASWTWMDESKSSLWEGTSPSLWTPGCFEFVLVSSDFMTRPPEWHLWDLLSPLGPEPGFDHLCWTSLLLGHQTESAWNCCSGVSSSAPSAWL